jgi:threonine/homoserine/homoserine lactone efflux protein
MTFTTWLSLLLVCLMGAMFPGASLAVVLRQTINNSPLHGVVTSISHALGVGVYALLSVLGLGLLLQQSPMLMKVISYAGAVYLLWIGIQGILAKPVKESSHAELKTEQTASLWNAARDGFMIALLNPKIGLYFLALFSQFIHPGMGFDAKAIFVLTIILVDGLWYILVSLVLSRGPILVWLKHNQLWVERILGVVLIVIALRIFLT